MYKFTDETMFEIYNTLKYDLEDEKDLIEIEVLNPDIQESVYSGENIEIESINHIYRGYKAWIDLAQKLNCKILTPIGKDKNFVLIKFKKLNKEETFHNENIKKEEKYGSKSIFSRINKNEEPDFLITYLESLKNVNIESKKRILSLGVNSAEEFDIIKKVSNNFDQIELVGIDFCPSAIKEAKKKFGKNKKVTFYEHDINNLEELNLDKFDLIISIGTLQSSSLNFYQSFMNIVQNNLHKNGALILGFPNCRWIDGEVVYGAKIKNYSYSEMSNLFKDANFCKKYLQQKKFRVTLTGKYYIFLTATSIRK